MTDKDEPPPFPSEHIKLIYDFFKHLTTLSTGCIVVIATFAKSLAQLHKPELAQSAVLFFSMCIAGSLFMAMFYAFRGKDDAEGMLAVFGFVVLAFTVFSLFLAIISLALFAVANLVPAT